MQQHPQQRLTAASTTAATTVDAPIAVSFPLTMSPDWNVLSPLPPRQLQTLLLPLLLVRKEGMEGWLKVAAVTEESLCCPTEEN